MLANRPFFSTIVSRYRDVMKIPPDAYTTHSIMDKSSIKWERFPDYHYAIQISLWLLKPIGVWPLDQSASTLENTVQRLSIATVIFLQLFMVVPYCIYMLTASLNLYELLRSICPLVYCSTILLRYLLLLFHRNDIKSCIERIATDWCNVILAKDREIMLTNAKSGRFFGIISAVFMFSSGIPYCIMPLAAAPLVTENNVTIRPLPNPSELLILNVQVSPVYEVVYILECFSLCSIYCVFSGICSLTAIFVTHICGQCDILTSLFENLIEGNDRSQNTIDQRITAAVVHHLRIIRFVSDVDKILNAICLAEFINASCNICLLGYYAIMDWKNQESKLEALVYCLALVSITFNIYIFCYIGELLVERCQKIGTACYMADWYQLPYQKARGFTLTIIMSNYPLELTAGKMLTMTMSSFSNILKTSMAYLNLLREISV